MEPLSKEEIDRIEQHDPDLYDIGPHLAKRLFFTARLGAEFERVCTMNGKGEKPLDTEAREV